MRGARDYAPLEQINRDNVKNLKVAWVWRSDNCGTAPEYKNEIKGSGDLKDAANWSCRAPAATR